MRPFLIAEISNHHLGDLQKAKQLILAAKKSGANAVKGQAFTPEDLLAAGGSMPESFYQKCTFTRQQYCDLILFGLRNAIPVFFTIGSRAYETLYGVQKYDKLHAAGSASCTVSRLKSFDRPRSFISMKTPRDDAGRLRYATLLLATGYLEDVSVEGYHEMQNFYKRPIGISLNSDDVSNLYYLHDAYNIPAVEKHFFLGDVIEWEGVVYRDCQHSFTPAQFQEMAEKLEKRP